MSEEIYNNHNQIDDDKSGIAKNKLEKEMGC